MVSSPRAVGEPEPPSSAASPSRIHLAPHLVPTPLYSGTALPGHASTQCSAALQAAIPGHP
ncbi:Hypothetical protein CAP_8911 [Chondromyces apiculatus DSM 436]|uniref:Uncharacterized protein n=1 Tax=Chondromyces apiculatus DSM 436 TaxID=1192034 RepID=A0A017SV97_9BACT|nr:Hypothetical protein CAP_8911 [Chondromyces apiculatus DSM 436]